MISLKDVLTWKKHQIWVVNPVPTIATQYFLWKHLEDLLNFFSVTVNNSFLPSLEEDPVFQLFLISTALLHSQKLKN